MHSYQGFGYITEITAVGRDGFFNEMLEIAGGQNVYDGPLSFPKLSREAIMTLNPDIIVDLIQGSEQSDLALNDWRGLGRIKAVDTDRIYLFSDESDTVPGPRIYKTIDKLSLSLFPASEPTPGLASSIESGPGDKPRATSETRLEAWPREPGPGSDTHPSDTHLGTEPRKPLSPERG
jgi:hypothetical protein